jgi:Nucleotidyl transferase of unknown function (DUF2204)
MAGDQSLSHELLRALQEATASMNQHGVSYALIGGLAASYRSQPRFTKDIDFLLDVPQVVLPRILDDFKSRGFEFDTLATIEEWIQHHMVTLSYQGIRVDWLKPVIPAYLHILERATDETWLDRPIRVASTEGLILLKLLAYRTQDQVDIENLVAAKSDKLDIDWITNEWQHLASVDDRRMRRLLELIGESKHVS